LRLSERFFHFVVVVVDDDDDDDDDDVRIVCNFIVFFAVYF